MDIGPACDYWPRPPRSSVPAPASSRSVPNDEEVDDGGIGVGIEESKSEA